MLLLVLGIEGWDCTTECERRQYIDVGSSCVQRQARRRQRHNLPQREWPTKQRVPLQGREPDEEQERDKENISLSRIRRSIVSINTTIASGSLPNASNHCIPAVGV